MMICLKRSFFAQSTPAVARALLGQHVMRQYNGLTLSGQIVETEAYGGDDDSASHAYQRRTARNAVMFGPPGTAYLYFVYGMHYMLNVVTEADGVAGAVLIRAIEPIRGQETMAHLRGLKGKRLTNGPAKLCQALAIDKSLNRWDLTGGRRLWLATGPAIDDEQVAVGPRVRIGYAAPEDQKAPKRFWINGNPYVSK